MTPFTLRPATDADIPAMAAIQTALNPNHPMTAETFAREMQEAHDHPLGLHEAYWVAELGGETLAYASVIQYAGLFHPDRYHAEVQVLERGRGQGLGTALAETMRAYLTERGAREVLSGMYEDDPAACGLLRRCGLEEVQRYFDSHLDLTAFDFGAWSAPLPAGVRVASYADLRAEQGEDAALSTYYDVYCATVPDVPAPAPRTLPDLAQFRKRTEDEHFRPGGVLFALIPDGQAAAFTELKSWEDDPTRLSIGFTGVRREWRRRGLALALKVAAMRDAHAQGVRRITTNAESGNAPMLTLNRRLGFQNDVGYVEYRWGKL